MHDAIERAQKADALIYAIGIGDRYTFNVDEGALRKIAEQTGGRAYFPKHERDLNDAFAQIQRDLREQIGRASCRESVDSHMRSEARRVEQVRGKGARET